MGRGGLDARTRHEVLGRLQGAREKIDQGELEQARELVNAAVGLAKKCGIERSAHVAWQLSVIHDYMGNPEMAYRYIREAVEADPLSLNFQQSFEVIVKRIRAMLTDPVLLPDDPSTPRLYAILAGEGEADAESHAAMARHLLAAGELERCARLVDAFTVLYPACAAAWRLKAQLARKNGDDDAAARFDAEAAACDGKPGMPFAMPGVAQG